VDLLAAPSYPTRIRKDRHAAVVISLAILLGAAFIGLWVSLLPWERVVKGQNDFLGIYAGAVLVHTPDLYSKAAIEKVQRRLADIWLPEVLSPRPPFYSALLSALTPLPYRVSYALYQALNLAALGLFFLLWAPRDRVLWLLGGVSIPVVTAFANGQDVLLALLICAVSIELARRRQLFLAGLILPLCALKFHIFIFLPVMLLVRKQWRILAGGETGMAALYLVAAMFQGWLWPLPYAHFLRTAEISPTPFTLPNLRGLLLATTGDNLKVELILSALVAVAVVYISVKSKDFAFAFAMCVVAGLLTSHHDAIQDCCLLLLVPVFAGSSMVRTVSLLLLAPPVYFLLLADGPVSGLVPLAMVALLGVSVLYVRSATATPIREA
jgi:hypothetical protein